MFAMALGVLLATGTVHGAESAAETPEQISTWFATSAESTVEWFLAPDKNWRRDALGSGPVQITTGEPTQRAALLTPTYSLSTDELGHDIPAAGELRLTDTYCARVIVNGSASDLLLCAILTDDGVEPAGLDEMDFNSPDADLSSAPLLTNASGTFAVDNTYVVAIDGAARENISGDTARRSAFVRAMAKRTAERAIIERVLGPTGGGEPPLMGENQRTAAWNSLVAEAHAASSRRAESLGEYSEVGSDPTSEAREVGPLLTLMAATAGLLAALVVGARIASTPAALARGVGRVVRGHR